ncbi:ABC transporter permease [Smaragdicoccus niigatensis]|uniref:ABC transporter permease n=1 Tax=Smaragdicoccus niigatensis TaxID=359359 RepID=UPI0003763CE0|nr:ABC transporter permease [Smaragdicoccus niigatensis]
MTIAQVDLSVIRKPAPTPTTLNQFSALLERNIRTIIIQWAWTYSVIAPLIFTAGYYLPLSWIMSGINYGQFVMPIIVLQTASFTMISVAQQAAIEASSGLTERLHTMPLSRIAPLMANLVSGLLKSALSIGAAIVYGYFVGFRFHGGVLGTLGFIGIALGTAFVLSLGADALGNYSRSVAVVGQTMTLPVLIFGMLSTGFVPEGGFPAWIRPFVRVQPVSQLSAALRELASAHPTFSAMWPGLAWLVGMFVAFLPLAIWARGRKS